MLLQMYSKLNQLYIYIYSFQIISPYRSLWSTEYSLILYSRSLLSILYIVCVKFLFFKIRKQVKEYQVDSFQRIRRNKLKEIKFMRRGLILSLREPRCSTEGEDKNSIRIYLAEEVRPSPISFMQNPRYFHT